MHNIFCDHFLMNKKKGEHTLTKKMVEIFHQFFFPDPESNDVVHTNRGTSGLLRTFCDKK